MPYELKTSRYNFALADQTETVAATQPAPVPAPAKPAVNALDFLKSRPQVAAMAQTQNSRPQKRAATPTPANPSKAAKTQVPDTGSYVYKRAMPSHDPGLKELKPLPTSSSRSDSWQQNETILEFLRRLPVADPATAEVGPWLWVRCSSQLQDRANDKDLASFIETASPLLDGLRKQRVTIEQQNPGKAVGTITRKMGPY